MLKEIEERNSLTPLVQPSETERDKLIKQEKVRLEIIAVLPKKYLDIESDQPFQDGSLFVAGPCGTGKTVFVCSVAKEHIKNGKRVKFLSYPAFIMQLQCLYRKENEDPFEFVLNFAKFSGYLIIDDFGAEKMTEFVRQTTYLLLNEREQRCLPIIITSNFSLSDLDTLIDSRISSRIAGMCKVVKFTGEDRRIGA